jgi:starch synthase (maltosyl-transferring)
MTRRVRGKRNIIRLWNFLEPIALITESGVAPRAFARPFSQAMRASSCSAALLSRTHEIFAPKIYYFHPLLAGPRGNWPAHLSRCRELGFDHIVSAPLFAPGKAGNLFLTADHESAHPSIDASRPADEVVKEFAQACQAHGLKLILDVELARVATDAAIVRSRPNWFHAADAATRVDPRSARRKTDAVYARFDKPAIAKEIAGWWIERLHRLVRAGVIGFRCENPQLVPSTIWRYVITAIKEGFPDCRFLAWTPGLDWQTIAALRGAEFDAAFSSVAWWDGRASWFVEEHELLRGFGSVIGCPEALYGARLARRLQNAADAKAQYRHLLRRAAATGDGLMIPMGLEFASTVDMDHGGGTADESIPVENCKAAFTAEIQDALSLADKLATLSGGEMRVLANPEQPVTAFLRSDAADVRYASYFAVVVINSDLQHAHPLPISLDPLPPAAGIAAVAREMIAADRDCRAPLAAGEIRLVGVRASAPIKLRRGERQATQVAALSRIVIDNVAPSIDGGRFPAKRVIGESIGIEADVFTDGHELLAVELLWRAADEKEWRRVHMQLINNDRWQATVAPDRIGRHEFTIESWWDRYGTFCRDLEVKHNAGADVSVEIVEGRRHLEQAKERAQSDQNKIVATALNWLTDAAVDASIEIFLARDLREVMQEAEERLYLYRREPHFAIDVERPQAAFGAWYELFPRSATDDPSRHGTFDDVIRRLPAIKDMGFDVLYLPPIHPIGVTNRKGKNNSLEVEPTDVGSPYAIGSSDGGHDAIHPALGTIEDFRRMRDAAAAHGMEIALDFAIQCSPDHPWLKAHPEWFNWRPDGTVRYAENPPKKYQDIVNVEFYARNTFPRLWNALRDVVLYWRGEGVRIFRVDNPHTKPLPFWEWLIAQVRGQYADVIFLSEAFTRPKMMYRLAKVGFSQSYTYFTWRNTKPELIEYFTELTTTDVKDYFRPHLFVNTPDINPYFLHTSGRPGFLIRAVLAATLSGLWGVYSGFELCEYAPLPGREEYLNSEKYEIRVRHFDAPGNITAEIAKLNRIRKSNPVLHSHLGLHFYPAHNDQVLFYGKISPDRADMILVAVNLDPFHAHEVTIEVPLWEWKLPDDTSIAVRDLMSDTTFAWRGKLQRIRLDPATIPFAIWRLAPRAGG